MPPKTRAKKLQSPTTPKTPTVMLKIPALSEIAQGPPSVVVAVTSGQKSKKRTAAEDPEPEVTPKAKRAKSLKSVAASEVYEANTHQKSMKRYLPPPMDVDINNQAMVIGADRVTTDSALQPSNKKQTHPASGSHQELTYEGDDSDNESAHSEFEDDYGSPSDGESSEDSLPENVLASYEKHMAHETPSWKTKMKHADHAPHIKKEKGVAKPEAWWDAEIPKRNPALVARFTKPSTSRENPPKPTAWWEADVPARNPALKAKFRKSSKPALASASLEKPMWNEPVELGALSATRVPQLIDVPEDVDDDVLPPLVNDSDDESDEVEIVEPRHGTWPVETHLVYPPPGAKIGLGPQNIQIQRTARASIKGLMRSIFWDDAFPNVGKRTAVSRDVLYDAARSLNYTTIANRINSDREYVEVFAGLPNPRIGLTRFEIKKFAAASVKGHYGLTGATIEEISDLAANDTYIYPRNPQTKKIENNRPYCHPILIDIIKAQIFTGANSIGVRHRSDFVSSLPGSKDELELPAAMVALVATAVYAGISEFLLGESKTDFSASLYTDVYNRHVGTLNDIKSRNHEAYHVLMANLFNECSGFSIASGSQTTIAGIDLDGMSTTIGSL